MGNNKLSHIDGIPLDTSSMLYVGDIPTLGKQNCPDRVATIQAEYQISTTYAQLENQANAFAHLLENLGLKRGDKIAYLSRNDDLYFSAIFGAMRAGVVLVPINWRLTAYEIAFQLQDSESRLLFFDNTIKPLAENAVKLSEMDIPMVPTEPGDEGDSLREKLQVEAPVYSSPKDYDQVVLMLYTSGTTGKPKGVLICHGAISFARHSELNSPDHKHLGEGCVMHSAMPNFHSGALSWVLMGLVRFGTVVITADPSPLNTLALLNKYQARHSFMVPTAIRTIIQHLKDTGEKAPAMDGIYYGAMPVGEQLLSDIMAYFNCPLTQYYGMTENTGSATCLGPEDHDLNRPELLKSVGLPYPGMSIEIRDPDGEAVPQGQHGEIWVRSDTLMKGYWHRPEATAEALVDGWYASGDGGYLNEEGYLYLTDRIKDMIVSGGENVFPAEVEEVLRQFPGVTDAAVVGVPDEKWGEKVVAVLEGPIADNPDPDGVMAHARERLAGYKCPKLVSFDTLPRTASGKVQRALIRKQLAENQ